MYLLQIANDLTALALLGGVSWRCGLGEGNALRELVSSLCEHNRMGKLTVPADGPAAFWSWSSAFDDTMR